MTKAMSIKIYGKVQGVNFRRFTNSLALELDLKGWVQNITDGTVEVYVEGNDAGLKVLIEKLKIGPEHSHVEKLELSLVDSIGCQEFIIKK